MLSVKETEKLLKQYYIDTRTLTIYKNSILNNEESTKRLKACLNSLESEVNFNIDVKSPAMQEFTPSNRQPPKGIDSAIDTQEALCNRYNQQITTLEIDILTTNEKVVDLVYKTQKIRSAIELLDYEQQKVLQYKLNDHKSFQLIADIMLKSKSAARAIYYKGLRNVAMWLERL